MGRYDNTRVKRKESGDRVYSYTLYPKVPIKNSDVFITPTYGTRLDLLAQEYYGDVSLWWIIARANEGFKGNTTLPINTKLIIPKEIGEILSELERLNSRVE